MEKCCTCITYKHDERRKIPGIHKLTLARYIVNHQQKIVTDIQQNIIGFCSVDSMHEKKNAYLGK